MSKVDVLEALAGLCNEHGIGKVEYDRRSGIYDAVAELIETLKCARDELSDLNSAYGAESVDQVICRCDAALAGVGGAK